jgi:hypothetical protein
MPEETTDKRHGATIQIKSRFFTVFCHMDILNLLSTEYKYSEKIMEELHNGKLHN